jgi:hypothetical protein
MNGELDTIQNTGLTVGTVLRQGKLAAVEAKNLTGSTINKITSTIHTIVTTGGPYVLDILSVIIIFIIIVLIILFSASGGSGRKKNNMYDSVISGSTNSVQINDYDNPEMDYYNDTENNKDKSYFKQTTMYKYLIEYYNNFIRTIARMFARKQTIESIDEKYLSERKFYSNGRCNNITNTDRNGYCYNQLKSKKINWNNNEIDYKLLSRNNMRSKDDKHYDYYVPNCKATNLFRKEYISTCEKGKRMNYICEI